MLIAGVRNLKLIKMKETKETPDIKITLYDTSVWSGERIDFG